MPEKATRPAEPGPIGKVLIMKHAAVAALCGILLALTHPNPAKAMAESGTLSPEARVPRLYAYLTVTHIPNAAVRRSLERAAGIRFVDFCAAAPDRSIFTYTVSLNHQSVAAIRDKLSSYARYGIRLDSIPAADRAPAMLLSRRSVLIAKVRFQSDVPRAERDSLLRAQGLKPFNGDRSIVRATTSQLRDLAASELVAGVSEYDTVYRPLNDVARVHTRVDSLQNLDYTTYPPTTAWMADSVHTGEGIWIGIYDDGIDTLVSDFRESGAFRGVSAWPTSASGGGANCCGHGTHVASIAAGNGAAPASPTAGRATSGAVWPSRLLCSATPARTYTPE